MRPLRWTGLTLHAYNTVTFLRRTFFPQSGISIFADLPQQSPSTSSRQPSNV